jgi:hypothetical protein
MKSESERPGASERLFAESARPQEASTPRTIEILGRNISWSLRQSLNAAELPDRKLIAGPDAALVT